MEPVTVIKRGDNGQQDQIMLAVQYLRREIYAVQYEKSGDDRNPFDVRKDFRLAVRLVTHLIEDMNATSHALMASTNLERYRAQILVMD